MRRELWNDGRIEKWYRQNMFWARKSNNAGNEPRLLPLIHPEMLFDLGSEQARQRVESGLMPIGWYLSLLPRAAAAKVQRRALTRRLSVRETRH